MLKENSADMSSATLKKRISSACLPVNTYFTHFAEVVMSVMKSFFGVVYSVTGLKCAD